MADTRKHLPISGQMQRAVRMAAEGSSTQQIADELGVHRSTVSRWFQREDMRTLRDSALLEVVRAMVPRAYAVLNEQLSNSNPWVAQNAARELIRLYNASQGSADANVAVVWSIPKPGAPGSAGGLPDGNAPIEVDFDA